MRKLAGVETQVVGLRTFRAQPQARMHCRRKLADHFRRLGVGAGDTVMLHASVRAVGPIAGGPDEIHLGLKEALTPEGTLIMYAGCPTYTDDIGRGQLTPDQERELLAKLPPFNPYTARANRDNGALVEFLRTYPGSTVNEHVTRFVVWGRHATYLVAPQPWNYAFGSGSLLERLVSLGGKILLLGCDHDNVTFLHYAEHVVDIPGKRVAKFKVAVEQDGQRVWRDVEEFDSSGAVAHPNWPDGFFARLVDTHLRATQNAGDLVGDARSYLLDCQSLLEFARRVMKAIAADQRRGTALLNA